MLKIKVLLASIFALLSSLVVVLYETNAILCIKYGMNFWELNGIASVAYVGILLIFIGVVLKLQCAVLAKNKENSLPQISSILVFIGCIFEAFKTLIILVIKLDELQQVSTMGMAYGMMYYVVYILSFILLACLIFVLSFVKRKKTNYEIGIKDLWFIPALIVFVSSIVYYVIGRYTSDLFLYWESDRCSNELFRLALMLLFVGLLFSVIYTDRITSQVKIGVNVGVQQTYPVRPRVQAPVTPQAQPSITQQVQPYVRPQVQPDEKARRISEAIKYYKDLCDTGAITQEEYERIKTQLLNSKV